MPLVPSLLVFASFTCGDPPVFHASVFFGDTAPKEKKRSFTLGKETTFITGPVNADGRINYLKALNDRLGRGVKPETNAHVPLVQAIGPKASPLGMPASFYKQLGIKEPPEKGDYIIDLNRFVREHARLETKEAEAVSNTLDRAMRRPWKAADFPHLAAWVKANEKPLGLVAEAVKRPYYFSPLVWEGDNPFMMAVTLPYAHRNQEFGTLLTLRAMLRTGEGQLKEAWKDLQTVHRLARLVAKGNSLVDALVATALEKDACECDLAFLEAARPEARECVSFLRDLQSLPPLPPFADFLDLHERFMFLDTIMYVDRDGALAIESLAGRSSRKDKGLFERVDFTTIQWDPSLRKANRLFDRTVAAMRDRNTVERERKLDEIDAELSKLKASINPADLLVAGKSGEENGSLIGDILISLLVPGTRKVITAEKTAEQTLHNTRAAFALEAFRRDEGRYPKTLDDLAPKYLKAVPNDIFTGKSLIYRPEKMGYLLYSVGPNRKDDGGRFHDDDPPGDDPSVRVPLRERKPRP